MPLTKLQGARITQPSVLTLTTATNDQDFANADIIRWNNSANGAMSGMKAGVDGQFVTIEAVGSAWMGFSPQDAGSQANNRFITTALTGNTIIAPGGSAMFRYDGTTLRWRMVAHNQGGSLPYTPTFSGFNTMTFTSVTPNVLYELRGNRLFLTWYGMAGTLGGTPTNQAFFTLPNGYIGSASPLPAQLGFVLLNNAGTGNFQGFVQVVQGANQASFVRNDSGAFTAGSLSAFGQFEVFVA